MNHSIIIKTLSLSFCLANLLLASDNSKSSPPQPDQAASHHFPSSPLLVPQPKHAVFNGKMVSVQRVRIVTEDFSDATPRLAKLLKRKGVRIDEHQGLKIQFKQSHDLTDEAYSIVINPTLVTVTASTTVGIQNGIHTLIQLFRPVDGKIVIPEGEITDAPTMKMRGVYLNLRAENYANPKSIPNLKLLFSTLAELKINTLFLEFADRVKYDSIKFPSAEKRAITKSQLKELIQYARDLHLEIIPFFQYLSHASWILSNPDNVELLENPKDKGWNTAWCPSNPKTNEFFDAILTETIELFHPKYIHVAMDEITHGPFHHCALCKKQTPSELFKKAILHVYDLLKSHDVRMIMFQDELLSYPNRYARHDATEGWKIVDSLPKDILINIWDYSTDRKEMKHQINYFTGKGFEVMGACFYRPENVHMMSEEYSANPKSVGMLATYWHHVGSWTQFILSPQVTAMTTLTAAYSWNPTKFSTTDPVVFDPVAEFGARGLRTPQDLIRFDQNPLILPTNRPLGNLAGNWPGKDLGRSLPPLPPVMTRGGIRFHLNQDQRLLVIGGAEGDDFPLQAQKISVNRKAKYLAFAHACGVPYNVSALNYLFGYRKTPLIGHYRISYKNGKTVDIPLKYRWNITDWNSRLSPIAGRTVYADTRENNIRFQLCSYLWTNPFPKETIATIELISKSYNGANIACLAVTVFSPSTRPIVFDDFAYESPEAFKKKWDPTLPTPHEIKFEKSGDSQEESMLVLTASTYLKVNRITLDKNIAFHENIFLTRNLTFAVQTNTPVMMGVYLGDGDPNWKNYHVRYIRLKKGMNDIDVSLMMNPAPGSGKLNWDQIKKFRLNFFLEQNTKTILKIHKIQLVHNRLQIKLNRGVWFDY